ncbi:carbon-nitrogen hydrolase family protein [Streptomyces sp. URMC 129]|uniref:carbon-nitrogen hydrolase family protein n=1 Tax=Streptomyces sp. URMC 129 TaxID=3423407 RepID=UPI003F1BFF0F
MSTFLTVALLQLDRPGHDLDANREAGEAACRRAKALGADIALFPEMWSNGYASAATPEQAEENVYRHPELWEDEEPVEVPGHRDAWHGEPVDRDSPFVTHFRTLAAGLDMAVALTYLERRDGPPRNTVSLIDRHGDLVLTQAKVHTCAFAWSESTLEPGDSFGVATLDTAVGDVEVGAMICYDREFPESARALMLAGAELILTPNACDLEQHRIAQFRTRAYENTVGVAMANYAGPGWGHSVAFDGMPFDEDGDYRDTLCVEAGEHPGVYPAVFDLGALRAYRRRETWGDAFRRPSAYGRLTDGGPPREPFTRVRRDGRPPRR